MINRKIDTMRSYVHEVDEAYIMGYLTRQTKPFVTFKTSIMVGNKSLLDFAEEFAIELKELVGCDVITTGFNPGAIILETSNDDIPCIAWLSRTHVGTMRKGRENINIDVAADPYIVKILSERFQTNFE